ncbi:hypothetical protein [Mucilaginibacter koreensis]
MKSKTTKRTEIFAKNKHFEFKAIFKRYKRFFRFNEDCTQKSKIKALKKNLLKAFI